MGTETSRRQNSLHMNFIVQLYEIINNEELEYCFEIKQELVF